MMSPRLRLVIAALVLFLWMAANFLLYRLTIMTGLGLRYLLIPPIVFAIVIFLGIRYVRAAYNLTGLRQGFQFFLACMFGMDYPILVISDGRPMLGEDEGNLLLQVGGPGILVVQNGSVAVVENYRGAIRVLGPGGYLLSRNEIVKDTTHLETRFQPIEKLPARSKDGIEVVAKEIRYRYRIASPSNSAEGPEEGASSLLPYSEEAILQMVYSRAQSASGTGSWEEEVRKIVESIITDFIRQHQVDYLVAPKSQGVDPRAEIYAEFYSPAGRKRFRDKGAELMWIDIGHFETPEENVAGQRVSTWRARWLGNENLMRDYEEAQEAGRADAQADILMNVVEGLAALGPPGEARHHLRPLYLARSAQLLDALNSQSLYSTEDEEDE